MGKNIEVLNIRLEELKNYIVAKVRLNNYDKKSFQMLLATDEYVLERLSTLKKEEVSEFLEQINFALPNTLTEASKFSAIDDLVYELYSFLIDLDHKQRIGEAEYQYFCELLEGLSFELSTTTRNDDMISQLKMLISAMCHEVIEKEHPFTILSDAFLDRIEELSDKEYNKLYHNYKHMHADLLENFVPVIKEIDFFENKMESIFLPSTKPIKVMLDDMCELRETIKDMKKSYKLSKNLKVNFSLFISKVDSLEKLFQGYSVDLNGYELLSEMNLEERKEFLNSYYEIITLQKETGFSKIKQDVNRKKANLKFGFRAKKNSVQEKKNQFMKSFSKENKRPFFTFPKDKQERDRRKADICSYKFYLECKKIVECKNLTGEVLEKYQKALKVFVKKYNSIYSNVDAFTVSAFFKVQGTLRSLNEFKAYFPYSQDTNMKKYVDNLLLANDLTEEEHADKLKHLDIIVKNAEYYISMLQDKEIKTRLLENYRESLRVKRVGIAAVLALGIFGFKGHKNSNEVLESVQIQNESYAFLKETPTLSTEFSLGSFEEDTVDIPNKLNLDSEVSLASVENTNYFANAFDKAKEESMNSTSKKETEGVKRLSFVSNLKENIGSFVKKFGKILNVNHKIVSQENESYTFLKETPTLSTEVTLGFIKEDTVDIPNKLNLDSEVSSLTLDNANYFANAFDKVKEESMNSTSKKEMEGIKRLSFVSNLKENIGSFVRKFGKNINHKIVSQENEMVFTIPTSLGETPKKEVFVITEFGNRETASNKVVIPEKIIDASKEKVSSQYIFDVVGDMKKKTSGSIVKIKEYTKNNSEKKKLKSELSTMRQNLLKLRESLNINYDENRTDIQPGSIVRSLEDLTLYTDVYSLKEQKNGKNAYYDEKEHLVESVVLEKDGDLKNVKDASLMDEYEKLGYERIGYTLMNQYSLLEFEGEGRCLKDSVTLIR